MKGLRKAFGEPGEAVSGFSKGAVRRSCACREAGGPSLIQFPHTQVGKGSWLHLLPSSKNWCFITNITAVMYNVKLTEGLHKTTLVSRGVSPGSPPGPSRLRAP